GKVQYAMTAAQKAVLDALDDGESWTDSFTYAIRLGNGTLSWATATIVFNGANDAPVLMDPVDISIADTAAPDDFGNVTGNLVGTDVDGEALTYGLTGATADNSIPGFD